MLLQTRVIGVDASVWPEFLELGGSVAANFSIPQGVAMAVPKQHGNTTETHF